MDFYKFLRKHDCTKKMYSWQFEGSSYVLKKLHKDIFLDRGARLLKEEIPGFPESEIITDPYTIDNKDVAEINHLYSSMEKELQDLRNKSAGDNKGMEMTIRLRARQKIELLKVPLLVEMANDLMEDGNSVVIMVNFSETIRAMSKQLNTKCIIWGENKGTERQDNIDAFQSDKERVILVNIYAGGVGTSLHDVNGKYPRVALISPNDSAPVFKQALGRVHRDGAKSKSQQRIIFIANTVEEDVCNNIKMKLRSMEMINDGDLNPLTKLGIINE
ncbi:MAG: helicase-related protein [bacterium]